jgi:hypothetical protein
LESSQEAERGSRQVRVWYTLARFVPGIVGLLFAVSLWAPRAEADFGIQQAGLQFTQENGLPASQAGSHPFALSTSIMFNAVGLGQDRAPDGSLEDMMIVLPPGVIGTLGHLPHCAHSLFLDNSCPAGAAVGVIRVLSHLETSEGTGLILMQAPIYNLVPGPGVSAELGVFPHALGTSIPLTFQLGITSDTPYASVATLRDTPQTLAAVGVQLVLWGSPGDPSHDPYRGACGDSFAIEVETYEALSAGACPLPEHPRPALLTMPTSCGPSAARFEATSYEGDRDVAIVQLPPLLGCADLLFDPKLTVAPTSRNANSPSGIDLSIDQDDEGLISADGVADAQLSGATFAFPPGMALNPPAAAGLGYCTPAQLSAESNLPSGGEGCPGSSEVGTADLITPLFAGDVEGKIFVAEPDDPTTETPGAENPFDARFAFYLVLDPPQGAPAIIQPILLRADAENGRVSAVAPSLPQLPLTHLELHFARGPGAALATPRTCATHLLSYTLQPTSGNPATVGARSFPIDDNCLERFHPSLGFQMSSHAAGTSGDLSLQLSSSSYEESPQAITLRMPSGVSAALGAVPLCPESAAAGAGCPTASRVGSIRVAVGAGSQPLWVPEETRPAADVFLAGPYRGAPFSLFTRLPAGAGPFDLGTVVLRAPVTIDPATGSLTLMITDLPQILAGVPLRYREIRLVVDRPGFIRTPTSCRVRQVTGTAVSGGGETATLRDGFRIGGCAALPFRPRLSLGLMGGLARNGHPTLRARLRAKSGEAGISALSFSLPPGELLDLRRLRAICGRELPAQRCPASSRLGYARLASPLLEDPLAGPIYLREPSGRLPDLLADLHSGGVRLLLRGRTATPGGRVRISFPDLPDLPLSKAVFALAGGRHGLIANSRSLCLARPRADVVLSAQNGKQLRLDPRFRLSGSCRSRGDDRPKNSSFSRYLQKTLLFP